MSDPTPTDDLTPLDAAVLPLAIGFDLGSSSARAVAMDAWGRAVARVKLPYGWTAITDGGLEADADEVADLADRAVDGILARLGPAVDDVTALGGSSLWHSLVGLGADGRPLTAATPWGDGRAARQAVLLSASVDAAAARRRTGAYFHPSFPPARIRWYQDEHPRLAARVACWCTLADYVSFRRTGSLVQSVSLASASGLYDQTAGSWDAELLDALGITAAQLPTIVERDVPLSTLRPPYAQRWAALAGRRWYPDVGDGAAANVGSGCLTPRRLALTVGTTAAVRMITEQPPAETPRGLFRYQLDARHWVVGGATSNAGNGLDWLRDVTRMPESAMLDAAIGARGPGAHGLDMLPFLAGERSPTWAPHAAGVIEGLSLATTPVDLAHAWMEAVAFRCVMMRDALAGDTTLGVPDAAPVVVSGSALRHFPAWLQIVADVFGSPVRLPANTESSARGAALLALSAAGALPASLTEVSEADAIPGLAAQVVQPRRDRHEAYAALRARHARLEARVPLDVRALAEP